MPSPERRDWGALLRSQGLGLCCGFSTVALLGIGSFVLAATRDGASAGIAGDDLLAFFERPSPAHLWLYALVAVFGLYLVNTALATWHAVTRKIAEGAWLPLPGGARARLRALAVERLPGGMPREVRAEVELRGESGDPEQVTVGYNRPISSGLGAELHLLADMGRVEVAELTLGRASCAAAAGGVCRLADLDLLVISTAGAGRLGPRALAKVRVSRAGAPQQIVWLTEGREAPIDDGRPLRLESLETRPAILVRSRSAPGNPWALFAGLAVVVGLALLWRRFLPRAAPTDGE
jgi:hypothetical protein